VLAKIVEEHRGKPGEITDRDKVFRISVIKGLEGRGEDLTIVRTIVDPKAESRLASPVTGSTHSGLAQQ
jgi:hypothetical protein